MEFLATMKSLTDETALDFSDAAFARIRGILKERRNFDIGSYKEKYMKRRIAIRVRATRSATADEYCGLLHGSDGEVDLLMKGLTIHVSHFFRNRPTFEWLRQEVLPSIFARIRKEGRDEVSIWSVGCSSGEEPYTLAIILRDSFADELKEFKVSIVATDINEGILETARRGEYGRERLQEAPEEVVERHFVHNGGRYQLVPDVKEMVSFRRGDLFDPASYEASDLILCRNVLIYFERGDQERILEGFANALPAGGVLVLGKAETLVGENRRRFAPICPVERIYMKNRFSAY
jgi:chemotaxis protein methyltransferase CheR